MTLIKNKETEQNRQFWAHVERVSKEAEEVIRRIVAEKKESEAGRGFAVRTR